MVRPASTVIGAFCLLEMAHAMIWSGPQVTPAGLVAVDGVSPRPTQAPGWDGLPVELRKRGAGQYVYPPPPNWCGFINGHYGMVDHNHGRTELIKTGRYGPFMQHRLYLCVLGEGFRLLHRSC